MHLVLIIKGDRNAAARAARDREVPITIIREKHGETIATTDEAHRARVACWFAAPPHWGPFPEGALLQYVDA